MNSSIVKDALLQITALCSIDDNCKNYLREKNGLEEILTVMRSQIGELRLISMYCLGCAVDINVFFQSDVSTVEGFA